MALAMMVAFQWRRSGMPSASNYYRSGHTEVLHTQSKKVE